MKTIAPFTPSADALKTMEQARALGIATEVTIGWIKAKARLGEIVSYNEAMSALAREIEEHLLIKAAPKMRLALLRMQWNTAERCPCCGAHQDNGHTPACLIGDALATVEGK